MTLRPTESPRTDSPFPDTTLFLPDQKRTLREVAVNRPHRRIDQLGPVENDLYFNARRQRFRNLKELGGNILGHDTAVLVDEHEDGTNHRLLAVHAARARAQITANPDVGDLADSDRNAAARCRNEIGRAHV